MTIKKYDRKHLSGNPDPFSRRLAQINAESPELEDIIKIYGVFLPLLRDTDFHFIPIIISQDEVRRNLNDGHPLLYNVDIEFDLYPVAHLIVTLANKIAEKGSSFAVLKLQAAFQEGRLDALNIASLAVSDEKDKILDAANMQTLNPDLLWTLSQLALKPAYFAARSQVSDFCEGMNWEKGECPICGAVATLGELRDNCLAKYLRCGRCGADWRISRLKCHLCQNEDHLTMGILHNVNKPSSARLDVCEKCKGYLKVITTFSPIAPEMIAIEDLATLPLDYAAQKFGYSRFTSFINALIKSPLDLVHSVCDNNL